MWVPKRAALLATGVIGGVVVAITGLTATPAFADAPGTVVTGGPDLNVRDCAATTCNIVRKVKNGQSLDIVCQVMDGEWIDGNWGWTQIWDQIQPVYLGNALVSDGFVDTHSNGPVAPACH